MERSLIISAAIGVLLLLVKPAAIGRPFAINLSYVGNSGNAADSTGYGAVAYDYSIGTYDITLAQ